MAKSVSLTRSVIGRVARSRGAARGIPRATPAITRIRAPFDASGGVALLGARREVVAQSHEFRAAGEHRIGRYHLVCQRTRTLGESQMAGLEERRDAKRRQPGLTCPEQVPRATQLEVGFGDR